MAINLPSCRAGVNSGADAPAAAVAETTTDSGLKDAVTNELVSLALPTAAQDDIVKHMEEASAAAQAEGLGPDMQAARALAAGLEAVERLIGEPDKAAQARKALFAGALAWAADKMPELNQDKLAETIRQAVKRTVASLAQTADAETATSRFLQDLATLTIKPLRANGTPFAIGSFPKAVVDGLFDAGVSSGEASTTTLKALAGFTTALVSQALVNGKGAESIEALLTATLVAGGEHQLTGDSVQASFQATLNGVAAAQPNLTPEQAQEIKSAIETLINKLVVDQVITAAVADTLVATATTTLRDVTSDQQTQVPTSPSGPASPTPSSPSPTPSPASVVTVPLAPTGLHAGTTTTNQITVIWSDNANDETAFELEQSSDGVYWTIVTTSIAANAISYPVTGLSLATTYYFRVRATNGAGSSSYTTMTATTPASGPAVGLSFGSIAALTKNASFGFNVSLVDSNNYVDTANTSQVTLTLCSTAATDSNCTSASGNLTGSGTPIVATASAGIASFTGLSIDSAGDFKFRVTATGGLQKASGTVTVNATYGTIAAAGAQYSCAIIAGGSVKCWGSNGYGQLGLGDTTYRGDNANEMGANLPLINLGTGRTAKQIAADYHTCAVLDNGTLKCWGYNDNGELGLGNTSRMGDGANEMGDNLPIVDLGAGRTVKQVGVGTYHTCALLDNGTVKCWGRANEGQLGQGNTNKLGDGANEMGDNLLPIDLGTGRTAVQISAFGLHSCALLDNGAVKCWGHNSFGQLGQGHTNHIGNDPNEMGDNLAAIDLGSGRTAKQVSAGTYHTCALLDDNTLKCWGANDIGQLGKGHINNLGDGANEMGANLTAIDLGTGRTAKYVVTAQDTCALLDNNTVKCWGNNSAGQLGRGDTHDWGDGPNEMGDNLPIVDLGPGRMVADIAAAPTHICALLDNGTVKCWGMNDGGQLGRGNNDYIGDDPNEMGANLPAISL